MRSLLSGAVLVADELPDRHNKLLNPLVGPSIPFTHATVHFPHALIHFAYPAVCFRKLLGHAIETAAGFGRELRHRLFQAVQTLSVSSRSHHSILPYGRCILAASRLKQQEDSP